MVIILSKMQTEDLMLYRAKLIFRIYDPKEHNIANKSFEFISSNERYTVTLRDDEVLVFTQKLDNGKYVDDMDRIVFAIKKKYIEEELEALSPSVILYRIPDTHGTLPIITGSGIPPFVLNNNSIANNSIAMTGTLQVPFSDTKIVHAPELPLFSKCQ